MIKTYLLPSITKCWICPKPNSNFSELESLMSVNKFMF